MKSNYPPLKISFNFLTTSLKFESNFIYTYFDTSIIVIGSIFFGVMPTWLSVSQETKVAVLPRQEKDARICKYKT